MTTVSSFFIVSDTTSEEDLKKSIIRTLPTRILDSTGSKSPSITTAFIQTGESILNIPIIIADDPSQNFTILLERTDINPGKMICGLS